MMVSTIFLSFTYIMQKLKTVLAKVFQLSLSQQTVDRLLNLEIFIGGALTSIALNMFPKSDVNLIKVFLYPRAIESLWELFKHQIPALEQYGIDREQYFRSQKWYHLPSYISAEALFCSATITLCVYAFAFESYALSPSLLKRIA